MQRFKLPRILLCVGLFWLAGCARQGHEAGVLHVAVEADPPTLDPAKSYDSSSIPFVRVLYRGLVDYDDNAGIVDAVAHSHMVSSDGKTYWFKLRRDARFHHDEKTGTAPGRRVTSNDFRFALERVLDPETASDGLALPGYLAIRGAKEFSEACGKFAEQLANQKLLPAQQADLRRQRAALHVEGIEVRGDDEIIFHLEDADATFLNYLTLPFAYAVPPESVARWGKSFSEHPNGCGPFILEEWVHDGWLRLKKNPHYYDRNLPRCERVNVQMGNKTTLQIMRFERGEIDLLDMTSAFPPDFLRLRDEPQWKPYVQHGPMMDIRYVALNCELPPFNDVRVRRAVNYAVNRQRITSFLAGRATVARGALPPGMPSYNPKLFQYAHDPAKARELLKQAGYKDKPMTFWYSTREGWYEKAAQSIKQDLAAVGMTINLKAVSYGDLKAQAGKRKNVQLAMMGWYQDFPDPSNFLDVLFNTKAITEVASQNRAFYSNRRNDALLDKARVEINREKRLQMYRDAEKIIVDDAPWLFLHHTERYLVSQPWIKGYKIHPMWSERYEFVEVKR